MYFLFSIPGGIQKRKDKPSNWFSESEVRENRVMKRIMSGKKFSILLRYLHVCSLQTPEGEAEYDPAYKVAELRDYLQVRYECLFVPGRQLSLDETLVRTFG